jgi:amino acid transporter
MFERFRRVVFGPPKDLQDPSLFRQLSLIPFYAWLGLGADGLSSSAYGPDEAYRSLGDHTYLAAYLALATALTVLIISFSYNRIIEHFPSGGGGYLVATRLLGKRAGVVSGCALIVDYVLTISVSLSSGADALFSFLPPAWLSLKLGVTLCAVLLLMALNLRGVRESVASFMPIFIAFLVCHAIFIGVGVAMHADRFGAVAGQISAGTSRDLHTLGLFGLLALFFRAYSLGGGTYTGIEAVSNGIQAMREPKPQNAKRTMVYLATSLAVTAGGILLLYLLTEARPVEGQTMNAVALGRLFSRFSPGGMPVGHWFVITTLVTEGALLFAAAQAGFIDGPRVMANMALDSWLPHSFASLSDRLTMRNGVLLIGSCSFALVLYTRGSVAALVVMYSINVFVTFSLSQLGMVRFWITRRHERKGWVRNLAIHLVGLVLCVSILLVTLVEKFTEGGWLTLLITGLLVGLCYVVRLDYRQVRRHLARLNQILADLPAAPALPVRQIDRTRPTALVFVRSYDGLGVHTLLNIQRTFPNFFRNYVFLHVGLLDSSSNKGSDQVEHLEEDAKVTGDRYVDLAHRLGLAAEARTILGTDPVADTAALALSASKDFDRSVAFAGVPMFENERAFDRLLHNRTPVAIQRRLQFAGLPMMLLPARITRTGNDYRLLADDDFDGDL